MSLVDAILTDRLAEMYNPFEALGINPDEVQGAPEIVSHEDYANRDKAYHLGRISYFLRMIGEDQDLDPISLDNVCDGGYIYPEPTVIDGNHRLAAAIIAKKKYINANYSGLVFLLNYLKGKRKKLPDYRNY